MAEKDITRDIGQVSPNNYIKPGVSTPSPLSLAASIGSQAIDLDVALAKERLAKESEALRTTYEVSSPPSGMVQDSTEPKVELGPGEKSQIDSLGKTLKSNEAAVSQGRMSYDEYRVRGERLLRMAISKRPGLAQEFRAVAAQHLGVDVVGASVDVLASWERQMLAAAAKQKEEKNEPDFKRMRDQLDLVGVVNGHMTDEQVLAAYGQNVSAVSQALQHQAINQVVTTEASTMKGRQDLNRPGATASFVAEAQKNRLDIYRTFSQGYAAFKSGMMTPDQITTVINNGQMDIQGRIGNLRMAMAQGDVDPAIAEKEIAGLESLGVMMTDLASGKLEGDVLKNKLDGTMLFMQNALMDNDNVSVLAAATKTFGPELMTTYLQPGGAFNKTGAIAVGEALLHTGRPESRASNAGSTVSALVRSVLDRGGAKSNPEMIPKMADTLTSAGVSFVEVDASKFRSDWLTGPNGYITTLNVHGEALGKALDDGSKEELLGAVSMAALSNYYALATAIGQKYPGLKGRLDFDLDPATGDFVRIKGKATPAEVAALRAYNRAFDGKKVLGVFQKIGGMDATSARNLLFSGNEAYKEMKKSQGGVEGKLKAFGEKSGFRPTSGKRTPEENKQVGGKPNSKHLSGEAVDFSIKGKSAEEIQAFIQQLEAEGYKVEKNLNHGTAPHIHAQT